ncbi:MAG: diacylglycerol kinase family protein [Trueperaceae bacterium]
MFTGRDTLVVLNPSSGRGDAREIEAAIDDELTDAGATRVVVRTTAAIDDATRWAESAADEGFDAVVAVGGDGTVTAVATGVLRSGHDLPIGIVARGTGNGVAQALRLPTEPQEGVRALRAGHPVTFDAIEVVSHDRWSLLFLGAGLDAQINRDADAGQKRRFGYLAYVGAAVRNVAGRRNRHVTLTVDGEARDVAAHTVSVINSGVVRLAGVEVGPPSDPHDGRLDVALFRSPHPLAALAQLLRLVGGRPGPAELLHATHVRVEAHPPLLMHVDGDVIGHTPFEARIRPRAVTFIADADYQATGLAPRRPRASPA